MWTLTRDLLSLTGCIVCSGSVNVCTYLWRNGKSLGKTNCVLKYAGSSCDALGACIGFNLKLEMLCSFSWIFLCLGPLELFAFIPCFLSVQRNAMMLNFSGWNG